MKKLIVFIMFVLMALAVSGFSDKISYLGISITNSTGGLYNGTYEVTSYLFYDSTCEGGADYSETSNVSIMDGNFGETLTYNLYLNTTFYIKVSIAGANQTCFEYTPAAQSDKANNASNADLFRGYTPSNLPISGNVSGTLSSSRVDALSLSIITYSGLFGFNNLTKCGANEILKTSGGVWTCDTDSTGSDTTCNDVVCTLNDDTLALSSLLYTGTLGFENLTVCGDGEVLKMSGSAWSCGSDATGATVSKWIIDNFYQYNNSDTQYFNETKLNETIIIITDARDTDTDTDTDTNVTAIQVTGTTTKTFNLEQPVLSNLTATWTDIDTNTLYYNSSFTLSQIPNDAGFWNNNQNITAFVNASCDARDTDTLWALNATVFQNETGNLGVKMGLWDGLFVALGTKLGNSTAEIIYAANASGVTYQFSVSGTAVATSDSTWTLHNSYPTACSGTSFVQAIGDTLTCAIPTYSQWPINATVFQNETGNLGVKMGLWDGLFVNAISDTMSGNLTLEAIHFEADANNHYIADNTTCIIIKGDTSLLEIC